MIFKQQKTLPGIRFYCLLTLTVVLVGNSYSQNSQNLQINWLENHKEFNEYAQFTIPFCEKGCNFTGETIVFTQTIKTNDFVDESSLSITNLQTETINESTLGDLSLMSIPESPDFKLKNAKAKREIFALLSFNPIYKDNGSLKRVTSLTFDYQPLINKAAFLNKNTPPVSNSILAQGNWYRFYVEKTGVHILNKSFLRSLGMDVDNIDPRSIKVYSYGGQPLPLLNSQNQFYDMPELAIQAIGEEDGRLDNGDFFLLYATATEGFTEENQTHINPYSDRAYYYITTRGGFGKRVLPFTQPTGTPTQNITTYNDYQYFEKDEFNIVNVGRRWFGNRFDINPVQNFSFEFPNRIESLPFNLRIVSAAVSASSSSIAVNVNGQAVGNMGFGPIATPTLARGFNLNSTATASGIIDIELSYNNNGNPNANAFLDFIAITAPSNLRGYGKQFEFSNPTVVNLNGIGEYSIENAQNISSVWNIIDFYNASRVDNNGNAIFNFRRNMGTAERFLAVDPSDFFTPRREANSRVANTNLKGSIFLDRQGQFRDIDYLIITPSNLINQANRLATHRINNDNLNVKVVSLDAIYTEFSSGKQDIGAIRNFVKYIYDNASAPDRRLKYLGLFGDASFDYKNRISNNSNIVPIFHALESFSLTGSFTTDDFFASMDPNEGRIVTSDLPDIAVGRIIAFDQKSARDAVDKLIAYDQPNALGSWRNILMMVSDDVDEDWEDIIQGSLDQLADEIFTNKPSFNTKKIYTDAFQQQSSAAGQRYPEAAKRILDDFEVGALVLNYFGHGGEDGLASEFIVTKQTGDQVINGRRNPRLPLIVTVTCEYSRFDNPERIAAGEIMYWNPEGGAIGLITTVRQIFVGTGIIFNDTLKKYLYAFGTDEFTSVAEAVRRTATDPALIGNANRRVVMFIGDPAMKLAVPKPDVRLTHINDVPITQPNDTLNALGKVKLSGQVVNRLGNIETDYNGTLRVTVYDKEIERSTLGNDNTFKNGQLIILDFKTLGEILFKGQAEVTNGQFDFEFIVPRDAQIPVGPGRVSFYTERDNKTDDRGGFSNDILIGGLNENAPVDNIGPEIRLFMNDESFVSGGITNADPILLAFLSDENGINTSSGIGHDISAVLDNDELNPFILNEYYEAEPNDFSRGVVRFPFRDIAPGLHTLRLKAWDVYNNSFTAEIQFIVAEDGGIRIENVLNYPNPFVNYTEFWFNHNKPGEPLDVQVQVYTVSGKVVWTQNQTITTDGFLSRDIVWN
ncbi:MAG: type IX secretion system sortase PorU, partial [Flavobacteriaceae bacterium]|nr:type IX secretion system sortase PorU [Flavobacteriaceae bacterium]